MPDCRRHTVQGRNQLSSSPRVTTRACPGSRTPGNFVEVGLGAIDDHDPLTRLTNER
jgi:hypothetical protein